MKKIFICIAILLTSCVGEVPHNAVLGRKVKILDMEYQLVTDSAGHEFYYGYSSHDAEYTPPFHYHLCKVCTKNDTK